MPSAAAAPFEEARRTFRWHPGRLHLAPLLLLAVLLLSSLDLFAGIPSALPPTIGRGGTARPLDFIENRGQWDRRAIYRADVGSVGVWFTAGGVIYDLPGRQGRYALRQQFVGGRYARPAGSGETGSRRSYVGGEKGAGITSRGFGEIRYDDVYPGIDVRYYGRDGGLKYDVVVDPGADPSRIVMAYEGTTPRVTPSGTVRLVTPLGEIVEGRPYSYQIVGGRRVEVPSRFERSGDRIGFRLGRYDRRLPLVIDPALVYSSYLGGTPTLNGTGADSARGIGLDGGGNLYVAGVTRSENFPTTIGSIILARLPDIFVAKFDPTGSSLIYATVLGGSGADLPAGIRVSRAGVVTVAGTTFSSDFPTSSQAFDRSFGGASDGFVFSLAADGALRYSTLLGGSGEDHIEAFTTDALDSAFVTGWTTSLNVVDVPRPVIIGTNRGRDAFVAKVGSNGQRLSFYTYIGADGDESGTAIVTEPGGAAYVAGWTTSGNGFPATTGNPSYRNVGAGQDCFVVKVRFTGELLDFSALIGGSGVDLPYGVAIDSSGGPYITGLTRSRNFPTTIVSDPESGSWFVTRFAWPSNGQLAYSRFVARSDSGWGATIQVDAAGNAYVAGPTNAAAFPVSADGFTGSSRGRFDIGLLKIDPDGHDLHASVIGGSGNDIPSQMSVLSPYGDLFLAGVTTSADLPIGRGAYDDQYDRAGDPTKPSDAFFLRFGFNRRPAIYAPPQITLPVLRCDSIQLHSIWIYNLGDSDLLITSSLFRNNGSRLSIDSIIPPLPTTEGQPFRIPPGDSIRYVIRYVSKGPVDNTSDFLEITSNDLLDGRRPLAVRIVARRSSPQLIPSPTTVTFEPVLLCSPVQRTVTARLSNPGSEPVDGIKASLASGANGITIAAAPPASIASGGGGDVVLRFLPTRAGILRDTLVVLYGTCGDTLRIPLAGRADSAGISFGRLELRITGVPSCETSLDTVVRVTNTGTVKLTLDSARFDGAGLLLMTPLPVQIDAGKSFDLRIRALLPASGNAAATLRLSATPCALRPEILIVVEKSPPDTLQALQPSLDFGVVAGCASEPSLKDLEITVRNAGTKAMSLEPASLPAPFSLAPGSSIPAELAPGGSFTATIRFVPAADGAVSGTLRIPYRSGSCRDTLEIPLTGVREQAVLIALPSTIDFGRFGECVSTRDTIILLENRSAVPIQVDEVSGLEGIVVRPTAPFAVSPNSRDSIRISFIPKQAGVIDGFVTFRTSPCGDSIRVRILAEKLGAVFTLGDGPLVFPDHLACDLPRTFDTLLPIRGSGSAQFRAEIRSVEAIGEGFSVDPSVVGRTFSPLDVLQLPVKFTPPRPGIYSGTVMVILGPCNDTLRLRVEGRVVGASLSVAGATFDQIPVDSSDTAEVVVVNTTTVNIDLGAVVNLSAPFTLLSSEPSLPGMLKPGDSVRLTFRFQPGIPGRFEATPTARVLAPCGFDVILPLSGSAVAREDSLTFCIGGTTSGLVGDTVLIPIDGFPTGALPAPADIEYLIRYDHRRLQFLGADAPALDGWSLDEGGVRLRQRGATGIERRQATLRFRVLLGSEATTVVRLDSVLIGADRHAAGICDDSVTVGISDRCVILGMKLGKYANLLEPVRPNPAGSVVEITYQQLEDARAVLTLHDMEGREVLRPLDQELPGGRYTVRVDVSDLSSGGYFYSISAGSWRESRMMLIAR